MNQLADALFTTTQQKVLGLLYGQPERSFYTREILRLTGMGVATIKRELDRMIAAGILHMTKIGNQHHYQANPECPIYTGLLGIVRKTLGEDKAIRVALLPFNAVKHTEDEICIDDDLCISKNSLMNLIRRFHIKRLSLFGSASRGELTADSDIDLLVEFKKDKAPSLGGMTVINEAFSSLFSGRKIDLATPAILINPYRRRAIEKDLEVLYAA